jgi:hypothetical protein
MLAGRPALFQKDAPMRAGLLVLSFAALVCTACGSAFSDRVADYRASATALNTAVDAHTTAVTNATPATCPGMMADYAKQAGALLGRMESMSGGMDRCMASMGRSADADLTAACTAARGELDAHVRACCASQDIPAELARHAAAMKGHTGRELGRMDEMGGMMGGGMMDCE